MTGTISPDPDGAGGNPFLAVRNGYDAAGRLIKVETGTLAAWQSEAVAPSAWPGFTVFRTAETAYDVMGRKTRDTLREGAAGAIRTLTQYSHDAAGRPDCIAVRMNPADFGSPPASACAQGTGAADRITRTVYDAADQRLQLREGVGTAIEAAEATWAYDLNGQVITVIDGNGNRAELRYDGHGRQDRWTFPSPTRATAFNDATQAIALASAGAVNAADYEAYTYDPSGNRTDLRKRDTRHIAFAYDALNRVTAKTYPQGGATAVHYAYDLRNLQLSARFTSQSGEGIVNIYDGFGRLASSSTNLDGVTRALSYRYDANGNRIRVTHPDGTRFETDHDGLGRPNALWLNETTAMAGLWYYPHGPPSGRSPANGAYSQWGYDAVQRVSWVQHKAAGTAADLFLYFAYNPANQIASRTQSNDAYAWTGAYTVNRPYTTNGLNQYTAAGSTTLGYDPNGNLISETPPSPAPPRTYAYDVENRLVGAPNGVTLRYDPLGRLYEVSGSSGTTRFLYDGDALVGEYSASGTLLRRYVHWGAGADVPYLWYEGATLASVHYLHTDQQGSIVLTTDAAGNPTINAYDEYGIPAAANTGRFQYTGQIWLAELGMYYYKARIYSPTLGRFLQTDPVGYQDQFNLYAYVGNDPVNGADPSGMETKTNCENVRATCAVTALTGTTFGAASSAEANMKAAQLAMAPITAGLVGSTGHEWLNVFDVNPDGSVTASVSVSDNSSTSVGNGMNELLDLTDNPGGDQHGHPGLPPGQSYEQPFDPPDADTADALASRENRPYNRTVIDGPTGNIISYVGRPGTSVQLPDGRWQRRADAQIGGDAHIIGTVPPIPYHVP